MEIIDRDGSIEKQLLTGMIVSDKFLKRLAPLFDPGICLWKLPLT